MKKMFFLIALLGFCYWFVPAYKRVTHGFRMAKFRLEWPHVAAWECEPESAEEQKKIEAILHQPFRYLGRGLQSNAFLSRDGQYVLKLFRFDQCALPHKKWEKAKHSKPFPANVSRNFNSFKLVYDRLKERSGLIYLHLNPKKLNVESISITDRRGRSHQIDPTKDRFVIQKKGQLLLHVLRKSLKNGSTKQILESYVDLLDVFKKAGLANQDPNIRGNFGVLHGQVFPIDTGCFYEDPEAALADVPKFSQAMSLYLEQQLPEANLVAKRLFFPQND